MNQPRLQDHPFERPVTPMAGFQPPRVPDHELLRRIGRGAYGEVWLARSVTGAYRAVKIVHRHSFDHDRPFEREFSGILRFEPISRKHESQVDILHVGRGKDCFYYVMELADDQVSGQQIDPDRYTPKTLKSEVFQRGKLPFEECIQISLALTTALDHLHTNGLVHRDVKPSNIIFVNGVPKLADIGLVTGVEATRSFVGTEGFAPPEGPGTPQADLYSLGKVLYEISTGKDRQEFPELPTNLDELTEREGLLELNAVIAKACREEPSARYGSAKAMRDDLLLLQSGKSLARLHTMQRTLGRLRKASLAIATVTVLAMCAWLYQSQQTKRTKKLAGDNLALAHQAQASAEGSRRNEQLLRENLYAADMNLAQQALAADNFNQALGLLQKHIPKSGEPDLRGFEWRYLWRQCQGEELFSLPASGQPVDTLAFSPDGRMLATGSYDGSVIISDVVSRSAIGTLTGHTDEVCCVSFSPSGDLLASATGSAVWLWSTKTLQPVRILAQAGVKARFSPNGKYLISGATGSPKLMVWDTRTWSIVNEFLLPNKLAYEPASQNPREGLLFDFAFSADAERIGVLTEYAVQLLSVPALRPLGRLHEQLPLRFRCLAFSPDGSTLVTGTRRATGDLKVWSLETQKPTKLLPDQSDRVYAVAFSPNGKQFATAGADQTVRLWDTASGQVTRTFKGHAAEIWDVAFSPDGSLLASVSRDGAIKVWNPAAQPNPRPHEMAGSRYLLGYDTAGDLLDWTQLRTPAIDPETLQTECLHASPNIMGRSVDTAFGVLLGDGHTLGLHTSSTNLLTPWDTWIPARGSFDRIELWDLNTGERICSVAGVAPSTSYAPERQLLATVTSNLTVSVWQVPRGLTKSLLAPFLQMGEAIPLLGLPLPLRKCVVFGATSPIALSRDGTMLAASVPDGGAIKVWKINGGSPRELVTVGLDKRTTRRQVAFSSDGSQLATTEWQGPVHLWSIPSGRAIGVLIGHRSEVSALAYSSDGRTLATSSSDGSRLWHVATQRELMRFPQAIYGFSPDGRTLAGGKGQGLVTWYAPSFAEIAVAEGKEYCSEITSENAAVCLAAAIALSKRDRSREALEELTKVIDYCARHPELQALRNKALRHRGQLLKRLGRSTEAGPDNCAALSIPARDRHTPSQLIDLSPYFNGSLTRSPFDHWTPVKPFLSALPRGLQTLAGSGGIQFDLRGVIQLNYIGWLSKPLFEAPRAVTQWDAVLRPDDVPGVPQSVDGITIKQVCRRLHFLHATDGLENDGCMIAAYVLHYADGRKEMIPILYGQDLRQWVVKNDSNDVCPSKVAWSGTNSELGPVRLFSQTWENPYPEIEIESLDFVSNMTQCAPFLVAITSEPVRGGSR